MQQLKDIDDQRTAAAIVDALTTFSNIVNRNEPPGTGIQLPVNSLQQLEKRRMDIINAKTEREKDLALIAYRNETLELQKDNMKIRQQEVRERAQERQLNREQRDIAEQRRERALKERIGEDDQKQIERYMKAAEGTHAFKTSETLINKASTVKELLDDAKVYGGQSLSMLGPVIATGIAGEVGVLTDKDVTRYVKNPALIDGAMDALAKAKASKITQTSYDNLMRLVDIMEAKARDVRTAVYKRKAEQLSKNSNLSVEDALQKLDPDYMPGEEKKASAQLKRPTEEQVQKYMQMYKLPKEQADAILTKRLNR